jgi:AbrB family looped-hinge helix DNA binding protein
MNKTKLSSKGQIIIPKWLREMHKWQPGLEFIVIDTGDGILLKPKQPFPESSIEEVAGSLTYTGRAITIDEMDAAIEKGVHADWNG